MDKILLIITERDTYTARTSSGKRFFEYDGKKEFFCYTLEDTARPVNIKVYGETCIPECECDVRLYSSPKFGDTIIYYSEPDGITLKVGKLKWIGALDHGGNGHIDTSGCVLIAKNRISNDMIQGSMKEESRKFLEQKVKEGYILKAKFINHDQLK